MRYGNNWAISVFPLNKMQAGSSMRDDLFTHKNIEEYERKTNF
jgi:hypothetical protein